MCRISYNLLSLIIAWKRLAMEDLGYAIGHGGGYAILIVNNQMIIPIWINVLVIEKQTTKKSNNAFALALH